VFLSYVVRHTLSPDAYSSVERRYSAVCSALIHEVAHVIRQRPLLTGVVDISRIDQRELEIAFVASDLVAAAYGFRTALACKSPRIDQREVETASGASQRLAYRRSLVVGEPVLVHRLEESCAHRIDLIV